jgi:hypothetical protein
MTDRPVLLSLSHDEALVLHEWLARVVDDENADGIAETLEDDAEVWALNAVYVLLEAALTEPFEPGFDKRLKAARKRLKDKAGPWPFDALDDP